MEMTKATVIAGFWLCLCLTPACESSCRDDEWVAANQAVFVEGGGLLFAGTSSKWEPPERLEGEAKPTGTLWAGELDPSGDPIWQTHIGTACAEKPTDIVATGDGGAIIVGNVAGPSKCTDADPSLGVIARLDSGGDLQGKFSVHTHSGDSGDCKSGSSSSAVALSHVAELSDGRIAVAGDAGLAVLNDDRVDWAMAPESGGRPVGLSVTSDGLVVAVRFPPAAKQSPDFVVTGFSNDGDMQWQRSAPTDTTKSTPGSPEIWWLSALTTTAKGTFLVYYNHFQSPDVSEGPQLVRLDDTGGVVERLEMDAATRPIHILENPAGGIAVVSQSSDGLRVDAYDERLEPRDALSIEYDRHLELGLTLRDGSLDVAESILVGTSGGLKSWNTGFDGSSTSCGRDAQAVTPVSLSPSSRRLADGKHRWRRVDICLADWDARHERRHANIPGEHCTGRP